MKTKTIYLLIVGVPHRMQGNSDCGVGLLAFNDEDDDDGEGEKDDILWI